MHIKKLCCSRKLRDGHKISKRPPTRSRVRALIGDVISVMSHSHAAECECPWLCTSGKTLETTPRWYATHIKPKRKSLSVCRLEVSNFVPSVTWWSKPFPVHLFDWKSSKNRERCDLRAKKSVKDWKEDDFALLIGVVSLRPHRF